MSSGLKVYYDGACPICVREMKSYMRMDRARRVEWFDITDQDEALLAEGVDPVKALHELHVRRADGSIAVGVDAFILLWKAVPLMRPIAWFVGLPLIKPLSEVAYRWVTVRRLKAEGRYCDPQKGTCGKEKG